MSPLSSHLGSCFCVNRENMIEFWFDFASTYSYPAAMRVAEVAARFECDVTWHPFLLGPIFKEQGWTDSPFNIYPVKGRYMWRDLERLCEALRIPFSQAIGVSTPQPARDPYRLRRRRERVGGGICAQGL